MHFMYYSKWVKDIKKFVQHYGWICESGMIKYKCENEEFYFFFFVPPTIPTLFLQAHKYNTFKIPDWHITFVNFKNVKNPHLKTLFLKNPPTRIHYRHLVGKLCTTMWNPVCLLQCVSWLCETASTEPKWYRDFSS